MFQTKKKRWGGGTRDVYLCNKSMTFCFLTEHFKSINKKNKKLLWKKGCIRGMKCSKKLNISKCLSHIQTLKTNDKSLKTRLQNFPSRLFQARSIKMRTLFTDRQGQGCSNNFCLKNNNKQTYFQSHKMLHNVLI